MTEFRVTTEIQSQPATWRRAVELGREVSALLPRTGERVAVVGCGTSWFMAQAYAALREQGGLGETDAFTATETPLRRRYDRIVAITRSGTTTEIIELLDAARVAALPTVVLTAVPGTPATRAADASIALDFADEESVVQTRYATSVLALLRSSLGEDLAGAIDDAATALTLPLDGLEEADQVSFLGTGWTIGLAHEAALKTREAAQFWSESYSAMEYRHGPISVAQPGRVVWCFGEPPAGLTDDVAATGARFETTTLDPMAHLILAQRLAVRLAELRGLDPDRPRHLTRAVELPARA